MPEININKTEIVVGEKRYQIWYEIYLNPRNIGCSMVGPGDLYDLGIRDEDLVKHGLRLEVNGDLVLFVDGKDI